MHWLTGTLAHFLLGAIAVMVYVFQTRAHAERRPPSAAIAWVLSLLLLPYAALPLYFVFGRRKQARPRATSAGAAEDRQTEWAPRLVCAFGVPAPRPASVRFDSDGHEALASAHALIEGARERLDIAIFILGDGEDAVARGLLDAMAAACARGVRARLLLDGLASRHVAIEAVRARGIEAKWFRPPLGRSDGTPRNLRNHRKLMLADGARLWSGGRNLAREYFVDAPGAPAWVDLSFVADGPIVQDAARLFEHDWQDRPGLPLAFDPPQSQAVEGADASGSRVQLLPSGPDLPEDCAHALLLGACFRAEREIVAATPYFVPDDALAHALRLASVRGVAVHVLLPAVSNHRLADVARARTMRDLAAAGVRFHLFPHMLHAKALTVDDTLALCGSTNLDPRSLFLNHELSVIFYGAAEIAWLRVWLQRHIEEAAAYVPLEPGLARDLLEGAVRSVAFQL